MSEEQATPQAPTEDTQTIEALAERVAQLEREAADWRDQYMRALADMKNLRRRTEVERADLIRSASAGLLVKLLPVIDDLERAVNSVTEDVAATPWYGGFRLIPQKLANLLDTEGVTAIASEGQNFDPNLHEAVIYEPAPGQEGVVTGELQRGYMLREKVLRPAMVKVGQG
jgi:molecular chaperone GrpE